MADTVNPTMAINLVIEEIMSNWITISKKFQSGEPLKAAGRLLIGAFPVLGALHLAEVAQKEPCCSNQHDGYFATALANILASTVFVLGLAVGSPVWMAGAAGLASSGVANAYYDWTITDDCSDFLT